MGRFVHDETLSDLADITASCNITTGQATADKPCMVTVTIEASRLQEILTCARLHLYDNPFRPDIREIVEQNNQAGQDWHDLMADTIEVLAGRVSMAQCPEQSHRLKDDSVALTRKIRKEMARIKTGAMVLRHQGERVDADLAAGETLQPDDTLKGLQSWFTAQNAQPLTGSEMVGLYKTMRDEPRAVEAKIAMALIASLQKANEEAETAKERVAAAKKALGAF
jgi:hypothetical protein